ncbi:MAG: tetratricopeptide repeat protein [Pyrinomonadaceae bacterium]|nr:tetratricopeptide repeat protein [Sphingobacteriaceae bacterium]
MKYTFYCLTRTFVSIFLVFGFFVSHAQTNLELGKSAFLNNKLSEAKAKLTEALKSPKEKKAALLWLTFLSEKYPQAGSPATYFEEFIKLEQNSAPYISALWSSVSPLYGYGKKNAAELSFMQKLIDSKIDGTLIAKAYSAIANHYESGNQKAEADRVYNKIGAIQNWTLTGEFENISASGFDKNYAPLNHPNIDAVFTDRYGAKVKWFSPSVARTDKWVDFTYYFSPYEAIVYAQTFLNSPSEQEVQLRAGVSGSLKIWINDKVVMSVPEERNNDLDAYIQTIKLHQGHNRVLVQVGESYAGKSNFLIRITDNNGINIPNITSTQTTEAYTVEKNYTSKTVIPFAEEYFKSLIKEDSSDVLNYILLAKNFLNNDMINESRNNLDHVRKLYPTSTFVTSLLVDLFQQSKNNTVMKSAREDIKTNDPESVTALEYLYEDDIEKENYEKAKEYTAKLEKIYGENDVNILKKYLELAAYTEKQSDLTRLTELAYSKYPEEADIVEYKFELESDIKKSNKSAIEVLKKYLQHNSDYELEETLADYYFKLNKTDEGIKVLENKIAKSPVAVGFYTKLSDVYFGQQNYVKAAEYLNQALEISPYDNDLHSRLAEIYLEQDNKNMAVKAYKRALSLYPLDYDSIKKLRDLEKKKDVFDYFKPYDVASIVRNAPNATAYPDANALILNVNTQSVVYASGASEERHMLLIKILNSTGLEQCKHTLIPVKSWQSYDIATAEVIKANGSKVPAEADETELVFTNLEIGDCVYIRFNLFNYSKGLLANKFWDTFYFNHGFPYIEANYSLLIAKDQPVWYKFSQKDIEADKSTVDEFDLYTWELTDQPGIKVEDKMPAYDDVANVLHITTIPDWDYVSKWYNDLAASKARPVYEVKAAVNSILRAGEKYSDTEKARLIYNFITQNITYSSVSFRQSGFVPQNPAAVLNTRIGDCKDVSTLYLAMAREAGIDAQLVLVNTRNNGVKSMILPSINFNHCMVKINTDNKVRYLELTSNYLPFTSLGSYSRHSIILDIDEKSDHKTINNLNPDTRMANNLSRLTKISIENEDLLISEKNYRTGSLAAYQRQSYINLSEKDKRKLMQEKMSALLHSSEITTLSFKNLDKSGNVDSIYTFLDYKLKNEIKKIGGMVILPLPWSEKAKSTDIALGTSPRKLPIDLSYMFYDKVTEEIKLQIPPGKTVIENVTPLTLSNDYFDYSLTLRALGQTLVYTRSMTYKNTFIPVEKTPEFITYYKKVVEADNKQIALK